MSSGETRSHEPHESELYHQFANWYERVFERFFRPRIVDTVRSMNIPSGARVLELGVGTGLSLSAYPQHADVTAVDLSDHMLAKAERKVEQSGWAHVELQQMDATKLEFADENFDYVTAFHLVTVVPEHQRLLSEMIRVCKPNGTVVIINHFRSPRRWVSHFVDLVNPITVRLGWRTTLGLKEFLGDLPLEVQRVFKTSFRSLFTVVIARKIGDPGELLTSQFSAACRHDQSVGPDSRSQSHAVAQVPQFKRRSRESVGLDS
jgi:phosphatidylethanolamine/phosphatidyl-N-methylethanolamine N-methyltransferase